MINFKLVFALIKCNSTFASSEYFNFTTFRVPLTLTWKNLSKKIDIYWFQHESDPSRNSNVYEIAQKVVNDNFPGEFGSERLVQQVVDSILASTELRENLQQVKGHHPTETPHGMEGVATASGGGGSSGGSPNKAQESEGMGRNDGGIVCLV